MATITDRKSQGKPKAKTPPKKKGVVKVSPAPALAQKSSKAKPAKVQVAPVKVSPGEVAKVEASKAQVAKAQVAKRTASPAKASKRKASPVKVSKGKVSKGKTSQDKTSQDKVSHVKAPVRVQESPEPAVPAALAVNLKLVDIAQSNVTAGLEFARDLAGARTPMEAVRVGMAYWYQNLNVAQSQALELRKLSAAMVTSANKPIRKQLRGI